MATVAELAAARHAARTARRNGLPQDCPYRNGDEHLQLVWARVYAVTRATIRQQQGIPAVLND